jgi:uncharacterized protein YbaP (TraB family)
VKKFLTFIFSALLIASQTTLSVSAQRKAARAKKAAETRGLLYKISGKNLQKPSYIFGTIHIICSADMFSMEKLTGYLDQTDRLLMELDMDDAEQLQSMGKGMIMPDGKTLHDLLTAEQYAKVDEMFKNNLGISVDKLKMVKPFALSVMISTNPKAIGCSPPAAYETALLQAATAKKKSVEGLETVASQFEALNKTPLEKQAKALYEMSLNPQKSFDAFRKLVAVYKEQDSDSLYAVMSGQMKGEAAMQTVLLDDRNKIWIPKIENAMREKSTFIAVGGGHLGGKTGVLKLLKAKGYKIEAIKL